MSVAARRLALLGLLASGLPLVLAGALAALGREAEAILALDQAFTLALVLAGGVVAVFWPLLALAPSLGPEALAPFPGPSTLRARATELAVLGAALAPGLRLAALLSRSPDEATARALVGLGALAFAQGAALAGLARTGLPRVHAVSACAALAVGGPLAGAFAEDAFGSGLGLGRASIPAALLAQLKGEEEPWGLALALVVVGVLSFAGALLSGRRAPGAPPRASAPLAPGAVVALGLLAALVTAGLGAGPAFAGDLELEPGEPRELLGPRVRPGELAPIRVRVRASAHGFDGEVGAESGGLAVLVPLKLAPGRTADVAIPAVGGGDGLRIVGRPSGGEAFTLPANDLQVLERWMPLVALGPNVPREIERALGPPGTALVHEPGDLLDLAADGGGALTVLALGKGGPLDQPGSSLARFAAEGGAVVLPDAAAVDAFSPGSGPRRDTLLLARRGLGAGTLVAPLTSAGVAALASSLSLHAHARRGLAPVGDALADRWPEPASSAHTAEKVALQTLVLLSVLVLVVILPARESRATARFLLAALALTVVAPWLVLEGARAPVYEDGATVLEAPSGGSLAGALEVLRFGSPRRLFAEIRLAGGPPVVALFPNEGAASRSPAELHRDAASAGLDAVGGRLRVPLGPGAPASFARRSVRELGGAVLVARDSVQNGLSVAIEEALLVIANKDGRQVVPLGALAPGATTAVATEPVPFEAFLVRARARPGFGDRDRKRLALLQAALPARGAEGTLRLVGFVALPAARRTTSGVLEEAPGETLLVVSLPAL